jgi:hypothetical protein
MITVSPGQSPSADQAAVADRLIALLPRRIAAVERAPSVVQGEPTVHRYPPGVNWMVIAIYIGVIFLCQWIATSIFEKPQAGVSPVPSPASTAREAPPSREDE